MQRFVYDAHGNLLNLAATQAATAYLYNGEPLDAKTGKQYLRARWYDPRTGTFDRLDPFSGVLEDPQSLHKYLYVHGDPIQGSDPSGLFEGLAGLLGSLSISTSQRGTQTAPQLAILRAFKTIEQVYQLLDRAYDTVNSLFSIVETLKDFLDLDDIVKGLKETFDVDRLFTAGVPNKLITTPRGQIKIPSGGSLRGQLGKFVGWLSTSDKATELIGEFGATLVGYLLGFTPAGLASSNTGIDGLLYHEQLDTYLVLETKGGTSRLNRKTNPDQFSHGWIEDRLEKLIAANLRQGSESGDAARKLRAANNSGRSMVAMVVNLNLRKGDGRLKVGLQLYEPFDKGSFKYWRGF